MFISSRELTFSMTIVKLVRKSEDIILFNERSRLLNSKLKYLLRILHVFYYYYSNIALNLHR